MKPFAASTMLALAAVLLAGPSLAKLPAPSDDAKARTAEAAAKTAHAGKVDAYQLCLAMDRLASTHQAAAKKAGKPASAPTATPACADPGPFAYQVIVAAALPATSAASAAVTTPATAHSSPTAPAATPAPATTPSTPLPKK